MSVILNGFYFLLAYTQGTCLQPNAADAGSPIYAWNCSGNTEQKWSITPTSVAGGYTIQNLRYQTYLTWPGGDPTGSVYQDIIQITNPMSWYVNEVQTSGSNTYILISPDSSFRYTWNVMGGSAANNTPIIMWPLDIAYDNSIFVAIPAPRDTLSSITLPTGSLTASLSITSPTATSTTTSAATGTTATSGDRSSSSAQPSASSKAGLTTDNKIGLGLGIGFGVPTILISLWGIWITIRIAQGRYEKHKLNKFKPLPSGDPMSAEAGHYEMPHVMGGPLPEEYTEQRRDWRYAQVGSPDRS